MHRWIKRLSEFLFPSESDSCLAILRIGLGMQTALYCLSLRKDWNDVLGGASGRELAEKILSVESPFVPRIGWLIGLAAKAGVREEIILSGGWIVLLCAALGLLFGVLSRYSAVLAWVLHLCAAKSGGVLSYGVDNFMTIGLFYLMLSPLPDGYALEHRWRKFRPQDRRVLGFFRRVLQVHLCVIYFFSGLTKCLGSGWWDGSNLWRALIRPPSNIVAPELLIGWKYLFPIAGIFICLLEIGYPFFIWPKQTRAIWLMSILGMHAAIGITMGMYLFALIMMILNVAAFGPGVISRPFRARSIRAAPDQQ